MKLFRRLATASLAVLLFAGLAPAQEKPANQANRVIPLKVEIVLSEYDGAKIISSLPYTIAVNSRPLQSPTLDWTHLRLGVRVPVVTSARPSSSGAIVNTQFQYMDVGTNIDCSALSLPDGSYQLNITTERSSVFTAGTVKETGDLHVSNIAPIIRNFRASNTLILRNGQTDESTIATDPVSGHTIRVSVTLHVVKSSS
jgi:hypothetical protein